MREQIQKLNMAIYSVDLSEKIRIAAEKHKNPIIRITVEFEEGPNSHPQQWSLLAYKDLLIASLKDVVEVDQAKQELRKAMFEMAEKL